LDSQGLYNKGFIHSVTFGRQKDFWWRFNDNNSLEIIRNFDFTNKNIITEKEIFGHEIEKIEAFMGDREWKDLANNVEKLNNGKEKNGIGRFLFDELGWSTTDCQLAGHLGVIFVLSGLWQYNGEIRGIKFRKIEDGWKNKITNYYKSKLSQGREENA